MPLVSIILPVYNASATLRETLGSVVNQTESDFELLLYDDGSTDDSLDIARSLDDPRIIVHASPENHGYAHWLNQGLKQARGEFIARLDADDVCRKDRLEKQVQAFREDSQLVLAGSQTVWINEAGVEVGEKSYPQADAAIRWELLFDNPFCHPAVMIRASVVRDRDLRYREELLPSEDFEMWTRLLRYGTGRNLSEPLLRYRVHAAQISRTRRDQQLEHHDAVVEMSLPEWVDSLPPREIRQGLRMVWQGHLLDTLPKGVTSEMLLKWTARFFREFLERFGGAPGSSEVDDRIRNCWKRIFWKANSWPTRLLVLIAWRRHFGVWGFRVPLL